MKKITHYDRKFHFFTQTYIADAKLLPFGKKFHLHNVLSRILSVNNYPQLATIAKEDRFGVNDYQQLPTIAKEDRFEVND